MWILVLVFVLVIVQDLIGGGSWITGVTAGVLIFALLMWLDDWWHSR